MACDNGKHLLAKPAQQMHLKSIQYMIVAVKGKGFQILW